MMKQLRTVEVVAALVVDSKGRVLATRCAPHRHGGAWEFPGGKLEQAETLEAALQRELEEELSVQVQVGDLLQTVEWDYPSFHLRMHCLICSLTSAGFRLHEHVAARWLSADELHSVDWLPADVEVLPALEKYLRRIGG